MHGDAACRLSTGNGDIMGLPIFRGRSNDGINSAAQPIDAFSTKFEQLETNGDCARLGPMLDLFDNTTNCCSLKRRQNSRRGLFAWHAVAASSHRNIHIDAKIIAKCDEVML